MYKKNRFHHLFIILFLVAGCAGSTESKRNTEAVTPPATDFSLPDDPKTFGSKEKVLTWTPYQQIVGYRNFDKIFPTRTIQRGQKIYPLGDNGPKLDPSRLQYKITNRVYGVEQYVAHNRIAGLLAIHKGNIVLEHYAFGNTPETHWVSFSIAKSVVSLLIGAAIKDGLIQNVKDPLTKYLPELKGTSYDGQSIENLLNMASGVRWNENFVDPNSDIGKSVKMNDQERSNYVLNRPIIAKPGRLFNYNSSEPHILGALLSKVTGLNLSTYLSRKIWGPFGMESNATWVLTEPGGEEYGGCCISATLRDYGRIGLFALTNGNSVLPKNWMQRSTEATSARHVPEPLQYGYLWWLIGNGIYNAAGIFGQTIIVDPTKELIFVTQSAWPQPASVIHYAHSLAFFRKLSSQL